MTQFRASWSTWVGGAAAAWSLLYGVAGLYWASGGHAFPFGSTRDPYARRQSILEHVEQSSAAPVVAGLGFLGAGVAAMLAVRTTRGASGIAATTVAWTYAVALTLVIPDGRLLIAAGHVPIVLLGKPFGWPPGVSLSSQLPWPVINQLLLVVGGLLWAGTALGYQRRVRRACAACGRGQAPHGWTTPDRAARWGTWATVLAMAVPLLYALTRYSWALGIPLGVTSEFLREEAADSPEIWVAGALMATLAVGGAILTLGLIQRWGEVYPFWIPGLRGKPVRPRTAVVPAALAAVFVTTSSVTGIRARLSGYYPDVGDNWATVAPGYAWPLWGVALGAATLAYHLRRRGRCGLCGRE